MASITQIREIFGHLQRRGSEIELRERAKVDQQRTLEETIVKDKSSVCPYMTPDRVLNVDAVKANTEIDDDQILQALVCLNNTLGYYPDDTTSSINIRRYFRNLVRIGSESSNGFAFQADIDGDKPFVIKVNQIGINKLDLLHEYFVGVYGTNQLRSQIPNFCYVYGIFKCSPPFVEGRKVVTFCQNDDPNKQYNYMITENIRNSVPMANFIQTCSLEQYLQVFCQVLLSIELAYQRFDYSHNDLHLLNVLITSGEEVTIEYSISKRKYYVRTRHIAHIIDQGSAHIKYQGKDYGYSYPQYDIRPDQAYPMGDLYKFVLNSLRTIGNPEYSSRSDIDQLYMEIRDLLSFWTGDNINLQKSQQYVVESGQFYYTLPHISDFEGSLLPLWKFVCRQYPEVSSFISTRTTHSVYGCLPNNNCKTFQDGIQLFTQPKEKITDPYTFINLLLQNTPQGESNEDQVTDSSFNLYSQLLTEGRQLFTEFTQQLIDYLEDKVPQLEQIIRQVNVISLKNNVTPKYRQRQDILRIFRRFVYDTIFCADLLTDIRHDLQVYQELNQTYPDMGGWETYEQWKEQISPLFDRVNTWINTIHQDIIDIDFNDPALRLIFEAISPVSLD